MTGANGFVGRTLCRTLIAQGHTVTGLVRSAEGCVTGVSEWVHRGADYAGLGCAWPEDLKADCVIHVAARVHVMRDEATDPDSAFRATNVEGTLRVARAALSHGVGRFVFVSSIKAIAETDRGTPLDEDTKPSPEDAYGRSKLEAEQALVRLRNETGLDVVIVRPPLVYGPQVRANFLKLMDALWRGVPLPLGSVAARRSLVCVTNLADALTCCATDPRAADQCFHVADDTALTVPELLRRLGEHLHRPARLLPAPPALLHMAGRLVGRSTQINRLTHSLQVDASHLKNTLGWHAPQSLDEGLAETANWYRAAHNH